MDGVELANIYNHSPDAQRGLAQTAHPGHSGAQTGPSSRENCHSLLLYKAICRHLFGLESVLTLPVHPAGHS